MPKIVALQRLSTQTLPSLSGYTAIWLARFNPIIFYCPQSAETVNEGREAPACKTDFTSHGYSNSACLTTALGPMCQSMF